MVARFQHQVIQAVENIKGCSVSFCLHVFSGGNHATTHAKEHFADEATVKREAKECSNYKYCSNFRAMFRIFGRL